MLEILLVDDEPSIRLTVGDALEAAGHQVTTAADGGEALALLDSRVFDAVISDIRLPRADGLAIFERTKERSPSTDVILITAYGDVSDAVTALKNGAYDYLTKPFSNDEITLRIDRLAQRRQMKKDLEQTRAALAAHSPSQTIIGRSPVVTQLHKRIETIARSDASVVISGESGTGKELVARALHEGSPRADKPFVVVNCSAFPETLIEAELFGHEKGAFTGAARKRDGRFKAADGGTLFLDEVGEIPPMVQAKLLRVLQEGTIEPLGTNTPVNVDVRVVCATHRNLKQLIEEGRFREDLFYRLNVLDIHVPPLRDRRGDLPLLVEHFLTRYTPEGQPKANISPRPWAALAEYAFPGNVRELEHAIQHAVVLAGEGDIELEHLPADIAGIANAASVDSSGGFRPLSVAVKEFEREYLLRALNLAQGKRIRAADLLGISRKNLWEKLRSHNVSDSDLDD